MSIRIVRNNEGNCVIFEGTTLPVYWNACLSARINPDDSNLIDIINDVETGQTGKEKQELSRTHYTEFTDQDGNSFSTPQECAEYITENANVQGFDGVGTDLTDKVIDFSLDATSTSIMLDNGYSYGVNTIKAVAGDDGTIHLLSAKNNLEYFTKIDHTLLTVNGSSVSGGLNDVVNTLNELFTVGAFESVVISDPYSTMVADVAGDDTSITYVGYGLDPIGSDIYGSTNSNSQNGLLTTETIDQAGEYFTFDIRVEGTIGFGLVHTQDSYDNELYSGSSAYADPSRFGIDNSAHYGFQYSHWFHPTPNGSWTNYGANTSYSMRSGWNNFNGTQEQTDWLDGNPIKVRVGIDTNGYISVDTLRDGVEWVPHSRTSYPVPQGSEYRLGIKTNHTGARVYSLPKVHLLEPSAPTMYFRYIESPDNNFNYPLFATEEEANYWDLVKGGSGTSHTHTYVDDPTNTTWYMPDTDSVMASVTNPVTADTNETNFFEGNAIVWTEITSLTDSDLIPTQFSASDITHEEGTSVNIQVTPQGASWATSVTISPSGSGLVYDGYSLVQGTLTDVGSDTTYTINVTRANSYGSSVGTMTVTATDVAPVTTNDTPWTKALDFSGGSEHLKQVTQSTGSNALRMGGLAQYATANSDTSKTSSHTYSRPWATAIVFQTPNNNTNQHIWNSGEGTSSGSDNMYLRMSGSNGELYFGWGREGVGYNEYHIGNFGGSYNQSSGQWWGIYISHDGTRLSAANATAANLTSAFDIRLMGTNDATPVFDTVYDVGNDVNKWTSTGVRMDRAITGDFTIGGRGANRSFHGKVASMVITTLRKGVTKPTDAEIKLMLTDPMKWEDDYKDGQSARYGFSGSSFIYGPSNSNSKYATQIWLMGDGTSDSYANGVRNHVDPTDQNNTKIQLNSMVSNDFETVNISGLT